MTKTLRIGAVALIFAAGGAMLAGAQTAPGTETARGATEAGRVVPAQFRDGDARRRGDHGRRHERRGARAGLLGAFGPAAPGRALVAADADGDGALTQAEIDAYLAARVAAADADGNGALALEEFAPIHAERTRARMVDAFQRLDADGSGAVTTDEIADRFGRVVARHDRNGDGALSPDDRRGRRE